MDLYVGSLGSYAFFQWHWTKSRNTCRTISALYKIIWTNWKMKLVLEGAALQSIVMMGEFFFN